VLRVVRLERAARRLPALQRLGEGGRRLRRAGVGRALREAVELHGQLGRVLRGGGGAPAPAADGGAPRRRDHGQAVRAELRLGARLLDARLGGAGGQLAALAAAHAILGRGRARRRRLARRAAALALRAAQLHSHRVVAELLGHVQRRAAARVLEVLLGARREQALDAVGTAHAAGAEQRGVARAVHQVDRGLVVQQQPDLLLAPAAARAHERGAPALVDGVHARVHLQQPLGQLELALVDLAHEETHAVLVARVDRAALVDP